MSPDVSLPSNQLKIRKKKKDHESPINLKACQFVY